MAQSALQTASGSGSEFQRRLLCELFANCYRYQRNNVDFERFKVPLFGRVRRQTEDVIFALSARVGFVPRPFRMEAAMGRLAAYAENFERLNEVYNLLGDDYSKSLFVDLILFRILGNRHVKLPINNESYWRKYHSVDHNYMKKRLTVDAGRFFLNQYEIAGKSGVVRLNATSLGFLAVFVLEQYHYLRGGVTIGAPSDGIVIDCGACWGDTSIYFADRVGPKGKVYALEFVKDNLDVLNQNRNVSGYMADRIEVVEKAASHTSGQTYPYTSRGPSTSIKKEIKSGQEQRTALTITIDDLVISKGMPRVDFIKMDIEGSELDALKGARKTIEQYKPRLAISLYHKQNDFFEIPEYLHEVNPDYEFYIDHFSIHQEETVLFARAKNG